MGIVTGVELIAAERARQLADEGWTAEHDKVHSEGEIAFAAAAYAIPEECRDYDIRNGEGVPFPWPWDAEWWKPSPDDRVRELAKAGALIAAEIDRLNAKPSRCNPAAGTHYHGEGDRCECGDEPNVATTPPRAAL